MPIRLRTELPDFADDNIWVNGQLSKADLLGKPVLFHFWAVSCHLCKEGLPIVNHWLEAYGEPYNLQIIGVHMPRSEKDTAIEQVEAAIKHYELTHPIIIDNKHAVTNAFQNEFVPAYYLFDQENQLRHYQAGERGLEIVNQRLLKILGVKE